MEDNITLENAKVKLKNNWVASKDYGCFTYSASPFSPPNEFALGNKFLYWQAGIDTYCGSLRGSTINHWGGWHFGQDLQKALEWLKTDNNGDTEHWFNK
jgi:hypothetical protein